MSDNKTPDFKDRYVLGEGIPVKVSTKRLHHESIGLAYEDMPLPAEFALKGYALPDCPRYRLVLERVELEDGVVQFRLSVRADDGHELTTDELAEFGLDIAGIAEKREWGICLT